MPAFEYIAKDAAGQEQAGLMQADSEATVVRSLTERSLYPVRVTVRTGPGGRKARARDLAAVYSQLADLLGSGVPALRCLEILCRAATSPTLRAVLEEVREEVSSGQTLADAMSRHSGTFAPLHVAMVRAGEHAGFLEQVLHNLAEFLERQDDLAGKVRGALVYPALLVSIGALVTLGLLIFLIPRFQTFLKDVPLPAPTRMIFALSTLLREQGLVVVALLAAVAVGVRAWFAGPEGRKTLERWKLKAPLVGRPVRMVAITRFCRVLGTLLHNGVPILGALQIARDATGNAILAEAVDAAAENVRAGQPLAEPLARSGLFPPEIVEMIAVGEESNQLEKVLVHTADTVERRTNREVDLAVRLIEPLLLVGLAAMIGTVVVLGVLYPILSLSMGVR